MKNHIDAKENVLMISNDPVILTKKKV